MYEYDYNNIRDVLHLNYDEINKLFSLIGIGSSRYVYSINNTLILKYAYKKRGIIQCNLENEVYNKCDNICREILCPVIAAQNKIIVMKKAIPLNYCMNEWGICNALDGNILMYLDEILLKIRYDKLLFHHLISQLCENYNLLYEDLIRISNWGVIDGKLVIIDYGCNKNLYYNYYK